MPATVRVHSPDRPPYKYSEHCPAPLAKLLDYFKWPKETSEQIGESINLIYSVAGGSSLMSPRLEQKINALLEKIATGSFRPQTPVPAPVNGKTTGAAAKFSPSARAIAAQLDEFPPGFAFGRAMPDGFSHLIELVDTLGGSCIMEQEIAGWHIGCFRMPPDKVQIFKKIGARDGEIVCP